MPYIMKGRNESAVYVETRCDVTSAKRWLWAYNRAANGHQCTLLHLFLYSARLIMEEYPQLDRFVSGRRIYQRKTSTASLMVKESMDTESPLYSVKLPFADAGESLGAYCLRIEAILRNAKAHHERTEKETELLLKLPDILIRTVLAVRKWLDDWNLLPSALLRDDPLYTSLFVSNGGSLGLPDAFHHLYEHGNCSAFAMICSLQKSAVADWDGNINVRDILPIRWTVDDRVADGFVCASALKRFQSFLEEPAQHLGSPEDAARRFEPQVKSPSMADNSQK
ncbi:MAG: 2-oxo acid dehydrogenase subunit E2 [Planctomycetaceae bacterium]|nr:2-oxo acid dehydrogenase subunit E2 [Planctomycetaceae bacterium]